MNPAVIIPAYRRAEALKRLLTALQDADYPFRNIKITISLDGGYSEDVENVADDFKSTFSWGDVEVIKREVPLGVRNHILWCGDQTDRFGAVIVLEEDILVDKNYYIYTTAALAKYEKEQKIAGISLYSYRYNEYAQLPFEPLNNGSTGYFMQIASSSGQCWTKEQWGNFKKWYLKASQKTIDRLVELPQTVKDWPESSWKKYFCAYLIESRTFFFYPYISYSTNCSDKGGMHIPQQTAVFHVPLASRSRPLEKFLFPDISKNQMIYDSFMEPMSDELFIGLGIAASDIEIDLYGIKPKTLIQRKKYVLTSRKQKKFIKIYQLLFRPIEKLYYAPEESLSDGTYAYLVESEVMQMCEKPGYDLARYYSYMPLPLYTKKRKSLVSFLFECF